MKILKFIFYLILIFSLFSCRSIKDNNSVYSQETDTIGLPFELNIVLASAICEYGAPYEFCQRGYNIYERLNLTNIFNSKYDTVFYYGFKEFIKDSIKDQNGYLNFISEREDTLVTPNNTIEFKVPFDYRLRILFNKIKIQPQYGRIYINRTSKVNSTMKYALFSMKIKCVYIGEQAFFMPSENKENVMHVCNTYYITDIYEITPISIDEYILKSNNTKLREMWSDTSFNSWRSKYERTNIFPCKYLK